MVFKTIIDTEILATHLDDPQWVIVDCRFTLTDVDAGRRAYDADHIPGAHYAHLNNDLSAPVTPLSGRHPLPDPDKLAAVFGRLGIARGRQVVAYDENTGAIAARLWWLLRWLGHDAVAVLDGGIGAWEREGRPLTTAVPAILPARFDAQINANQWVDSSCIEKMITEGRGLILDARAKERFRGELEPMDAVAGHIPGAVNMPYTENLDSTGKFTASVDLDRLYKARLGSRTAADTVVMCGSGVTACHTLLALEHIGLRGARLYAGSWSEWIRDRHRPIAQGG